MLIGFSFENIYSYRNENTFSLIASNINEHKDKIFNIRKSKTKQIDLLKFSALYGKNASGKSNVFKALSLMKNFIFNSTKMDANSIINLSNFKLNEESKNKPSLFEVAFVIEGVIYKYGYKIFENQVIEEWLLQNKKRFTTLFHRKSAESNSIEIGNSFKEGKKVPKNQLRKNALFLPVVAAFNGEISNKILNWFKSINIISGESILNNFTLSFSEGEKNKKEVIEFLKIADLNINDFSVEQQEMKEELKKLIENLNINDGKIENMKEVKVKTSHLKYNNQYEVVGKLDFDMDILESEGTKKFFSLSGPILDTLTNGKILFIDELDSKLHPLMVKFIIELFNSASKNPNNAQLIINTHNVNVMKKDILRRDQIWFVEKNEFGESELYSLDEYKDEKTNKKVRNDESYEKNYMLGKYGAIPYIQEEFMVLNEFELFGGE